MLLIGPFLPFKQILCVILYSGYKNLIWYFPIDTKDYMAKIVIRVHLLDYGNYCIITDESYRCKDSE